MYLEHLDERDAERQVRDVPADQAQREKEPDGYDRSEIDLPRHLDSKPSVQQRRRSCQRLRRERSEYQMPCCEEDCCYP